MSDFIEMVVIAVVIVSLIVVGLGSIFFVGNHLSFPGAVAQIEQLRRDASKVNISEAEDVMGQVTQVNQEIASHRAYNQMPFICLLIPNGWDSVEPIEIRSGR